MVRDEQEISRPKVGVDCSCGICQKQPAYTKAAHYFHWEDYRSPAGAFVEVATSAEGNRAAATDLEEPHFAGMALDRA